MDLSNLFDMINALGVEWTCKACNVTSDSKFIIEKGHYHCPACGGSARIGTDTVNWVGKRARWKLGLRKIEGSDDVFNEIKGALPLD